MRSGNEAEVNCRSRKGCGQDEVKVSSDKQTRCGQENPELLKRVEYCTQGTLRLVTMPRLKIGKLRLRLIER